MKTDHVPARALGGTAALDNGCGTCDTSSPRDHCAACPRYAAGPAHAAPQPSSSAHWVLNYPSELLRQWLAHVTAAEAARVQLGPRHLRALAQDALAAHDFRTALMELVLCHQINERIDALPQGTERYQLQLRHAARVQAAWKLAFDTVGVPSPCAPNLRPASAPATERAAP